MRSGVGDLLLRMIPFENKWLLGSMERKKKEGGGGCWCSRTSTEGYGVSLWKAIRCGWKGFNDRNGFRVGNDKMVRF